MGETEAFLRLQLEAAQSKVTEVEHDLRASERERSDFANEIDELKNELTALKNQNELIRKNAELTPTIPIFRGEIGSDFKEWSEKFDREAQYFEWTDPQRAKKLPRYLDDYALAGSLSRPVR